MLNGRRGTIYRDWAVRIIDLPQVEAIGKHDLV